MGGCTLYHWSKLQSNVALSSGEAELNGAVKGLSEALGLWHVIKEVTGAEVKMKMHTDASACKGMLLRHGAGRVKHLTTKQLWAQGAVRAYAVEVIKVARDDNHADCLTHEVPQHLLTDGLMRMGFQFMTHNDAHLHGSAGNP